MLNKNNKKNNFNELFEVAYNKLKKYAELNNIPIDAAVKRCIEVGIRAI